MTIRVLASEERATQEQSVFNELLARNFNPDAYHVMQQRDEALIRDQVIHGYANKDFVYRFSIGGKTVTGISVVGAREIASKYGGIKARIVATIEKRGPLFIFCTFSPPTIDTRHIYDLAEQEDFYECVMEVQDLKSGNSIEVRKKEFRREKTGQGKMFERPHYSSIAESKAYRNGVLSILPQNVISEFEERCLKAGNVSNEKTLDQLRDGALSFASKNGIAVDRVAFSALTYAELYGLGSSAAGGAKQFSETCQSLGLLREVVKDNEEKHAGKKQSREAQQKEQPVEERKNDEAVDRATGEISSGDEEHKLTEFEIDKLKDMATLAALSYGEIFKKFGVVSWTELPQSKLQDVIAWIKNPS